MTFRQQRHCQKDRRGGSGKSDADFDVAVRAKAPLQSSPDVVERCEVGRPLCTRRQGLPVGPGLFQPSPVVGGVAYRQVTEVGVVDFGFDYVGARRVEKPVAHHRTDGTGRDH